MKKDKIKRRIDMREHNKIFHLEIPQGKSLLVDIKAERAKYRDF